VSAGIFIEAIGMDGWESTGARRCQEEPNESISGFDFPDSLHTFPGGERGFLFVFPGKGLPAK